jgi:hypothetical protein
VQLVALESFLQRRVDDALITFHPGDKFAGLAIHKFDVCAGRMFVNISYPDHDMGAVTRESLAELAVSPGKCRERSGSGAIKTPEDHHLECAVHHQRIGKPTASEWLFDPERREWRPLDHGRYPFGGTALHLLYAVEVSSVEKPFLVIDDSVMRDKRGFWQFGYGADSLREACGQDYLGPRMELIVAICVSAVQFQRHDMKRILFLSLTRQYPESAGCAVIENDPFADTEIVETVEPQTWIAVQCAMGKPLDYYRHWQYSLAVNYM